MTISYRASTHAAPTPQVRHLVLVPPPEDVSPAQQAFVTARAQLLPRAGVRGDRLTTALYLILLAHAGAPTDGASGTDLCCAECGAGEREPHQAYPCPTAEQAFWALDATLR